MIKFLIKLQAKPKHQNQHKLFEKLQIDINYLNKCEIITRLDSILLMCTSFSSFYRQKNFMT